MKRLNARLYERLTPEERVRLALEAMARDDEREMKRLAESCPKKTYAMRDAAFLGLVDASRHLAFYFSLLWLEGYRRWQVAQAAALVCEEAIGLLVRGYVLGVNAAWEWARQEGVLFDVDGRAPTDEELLGAGLAAACEATPAKLRARLKEAEETLRAVWQGFAAFCREKSLDPEAMLAWWPPVLDQVRREREWLEAPAPAEEAEAAREAFAAVWERVAG